MRTRERDRERKRETEKEREREREKKKERERITIPYLGLVYSAHTFAVHGPQGLSESWIPQSSRQNR